MVLNNLLLLLAMTWSVGTLVTVLYYVLVVERWEPYDGADLDWDYNPAVRYMARYPKASHVADRCHGYPTAGGHQAWPPLPG